MKQKLHAWLCLSFLCLLTACEQNDEPVAPEVGSRTVLVYVVADNNLAPFAEEDVTEMMEGMKSVDTSLYNLLVYQDDRDTPVLFRFVKDGDGTVKKETVREYAEQNSTDVEVMKEVLNRAFFEYPAESYGLVYWSHADGWIPYPVPSSAANTRWVGQDTDSGDNRMNLEDLLAVLDEAPHFDFIHFDACFMASIEVAYALRDYTDYYIGCPTENPGPGAPYDTVVPQMFTSNAALNIAAKYFEYYQNIYAGGAGITNDNWTGGVSVTVLKSSELENLAAATAAALTEQEADNTQLRQEVLNYDKRSSSSMVGYYDFPQMMELLLDADVYTTWKEAFDTSVGYWQTTAMNYSQYAGMFSMEKASGVSHYIPRDVSSAAARAYRSTEWYRAAGLEKLRW